VEQLRLEKQTAFETRPEDWRNSEQGYRLEDDIALLEDLSDALKTVLHQVHDLFTPETNAIHTSGRVAPGLPSPKWKGCAQSCL
jgi:hypothetical protein